MTEQIVANLIAGLLCTCLVGLSIWLVKTYRRIVGIEETQQEILSACESSIVRLDDHSGRIQRLEHRQI